MGKIVGAKPGGYVGVPEIFSLGHCCKFICDAFGEHTCYLVCSMDCYKRWVQGRALFKTIHTMKEMQARSFEKMQSVFNYGTAGEYAKEKHAMLQMSPFLFLCKLDKGNLQKLADAIGF